MLLDLDMFWLAMAVASVGVVALVLGTALDSLMADDGFGAMGNMIVLTAGFFLGILLANHFGWRFDKLVTACGAGLGGSFVTIAGLAAIKAGLARLFAT